MEIIEFGLLDHHSLPWIGASPDGITPDGVMLEIKCPNVRRIKPREFPIYYWVQMQIQLEVCDLDECDYIECNIKNTDLEGFGCAPADKYPGIILQVPGTEQHIYPPMNIITTQEYLDWVQAQDPSLIPVFYYIENYQILNIKRDKKWFEHVKPKMKAVFDTIHYLQNDTDAWKQYYQAFLDEKHKKFNDFFQDSVCNIGKDTFTRTELDIMIQTKISEQNDQECLIDDV